MVSSVKARKMLSKMCIAYLVHIVNRSNEAIHSVKDTPIVQEFLYIFSDNLSRLAPKREVKFSIELTLVTMPVSKAPYKMSLVELQELKK